jgi:hypothetical protein
MAYNITIDQPEDKSSDFKPIVADTSYKIKIDQPEEKSKSTWEKFKGLFSSPESENTNNKDTVPQPAAPQTPLLQPEKQTQAQALPSNQPRQIDKNAGILTKAKQLMPPGESLITTPKQSLWQDIKSKVITPNVTPEKAAMTVGMSEQTRISPTKVLHNFEDIQEGVIERGKPTLKQAAGTAMKLGITAGLATNPVSTATVLGTFFGLDELKNLIVSKIQKEPYKFQEGKGISDLLKSEGLSKDAIDLGEFVVEGMIAGGMTDVGRGIFGDVVRKISGGENKVKFINDVAKEAKETGTAPDEIVKKRADDFYGKKLPKSKINESGLNLKEEARRSKMDKYDLMIEDFENRESGVVKDIAKEIDKTKPIIKPVIETDNGIIPGKEGESHPDIIKEHKLDTKDIAENDKKFVGEDGNVLNRDEAKDLIKTQQPEVHEELVKKLGEDYELHSEDYNDALDKLNKDEVKKPEEGKNATEEGEVKTGDLGEHSGVGEVGKESEASSGDSNEPSGEGKKETEKSITDQAKDLNLKAEKWPDLDMYTITDPENGGNFEVKVGENVADKLKEHREKDWSGKEKEVKPETLKENEGEPVYSIGLNSFRDSMGKFFKTKTGTEISDLSKRLFSPESISANARKVGAMLIKAITGDEHIKAQLMKASEERKNEWDRQGKEKHLEFMFGIEEPEKLPANLKGLAKEYRESLDDIYKRETKAGINYSYRTDYFPHIFKDPKGVDEFIQSRIASLGKDRFTKEREIDLLKDAIKAGYELKTTNPEELKLMRQFSAEAAITKMNFVNDLIGRNLAAKWEADMARKGYTKLYAPDGNLYGVPNDIYPVINNAILQPSLWSDPSLKGNMFRKVSEAKNLIVPVKLSLNLFHAVHVLTISPSARIAQALEHGIKGGGTIGEMFKDIGKAFLQMHQKEELGEGWRIMQAWDKPTPNLSADDAMAIQYLKEGGVVPKMSEEWKSKASDAWKKAWREDKYVKMATKVIPTGLDYMQKPLFEMYIPAIKTGSYLHEVKLLLERRPELLKDENADERGIELRAIGDSAQNRFGEVFYKGVFMSKSIKEAGILSSLSMGWNLGNVRELGGGIKDTLSLINKLSKLEKVTRDDITRKMLYTGVYTFNSAIIGGLITYGMTQEFPKGLDYFYPRTGDKKADGSPIRFNTPFSTRDLFSVYYNVSKDGLLGGMSSVVSGKMNPMISPLLSVWKNEDFQHREIKDADDPTIKQVWDVMKYLSKTALSPISFDSYKREKQAGMSSQKSFIATALGFNLAPAYITNTAMQNEISNLMSKRFAGVKPLEGNKVSDAKSKIISLYQQGKDDEAETELDKLKETGKISDEGVTSFLRTIDLPGDIRSFHRLTATDQEHLIKKMTMTDLNRYAWFAKKNVIDDLDMISPVTKQFIDDIESGKIKQPTWDHGKYVSQGEGNEIEDQD